MFAAVVLGVAGIMRIFDAIWSFRYHGCSRTYIAPGALVIYALATYGGNAEAV